MTMRSAGISEKRLGILGAVVVWGHAASSGMNSSVSRGCAVHRDDGVVPTFFLCGVPVPASALHAKFIGYRALGAHSADCEQLAQDLGRRAGQGGGPELDHCCWIIREQGC